MRITEEVACESVTTEREAMEASSPLIVYMMPKDESTNGMIAMISMFIWFILRDCKRGERGVRGARPCTNGFEE
jgi:hypothetical protein